MPSLRDRSHPWRPCRGQPAATRSWTLWASPANGVPFGVFPTLAYAPETHTLYYSTRLHPFPRRHPRVGVDLRHEQPTPAFTKLPQTGLVLPTPKPGPRP